LQEPEGWTAEPSSVRASVRDRRIDKGKIMKLEAVSIHPPLGLAELIMDLGSGENGFGGTPVPSGELTLPDYIQKCIEMTDVKKVQPGHVPQTTFWVVDDKGEAIGIVRMRHHLNDRLKERGGHLGFYIRRDKRGNGYGKEALRQALMELRKMGERRALLTTDVDNMASRKIIETNGGTMESLGQGVDGKNFARYWIDLDS
jgi:predicted acetyltransferase